MSMPLWGLLAYSHFHLGAVGSSTSVVEIDDDHDRPVRDQPAAKSKEERQLAQAPGVNEERVVDRRRTRDRDGSSRRKRCEAGDSQGRRRRDKRPLRSGEDIRERAPPETIREREAQSAENKVFPGYDHDGNSYTERRSAWTRPMGQELRPDGQWLCCERRLQCGFRCCRCGGTRTRAVARGHGRQ